MGERAYALNHAPIDFYFKQSSDDFIVDEVPLYEFSGEGEHLILEIRKKNLTTEEMIRHLCAATGVQSKFVGYAGLKDKKALTRQFVSIPRKSEELLKNIENSQIKILSKTYHNNKIRIGHLKGNRFFIRVKRLNPIESKKLEGAIEAIQREGMPNYFGYQRFGNFGDNFEMGRKIAAKELKMRDRKKARFMLSAYQSYLFNAWLSRRVIISKIVDEFSIEEIAQALHVEKEAAVEMKNQEMLFKIVQGDIMHHYPYGKIFDVENLQEESLRFAKRESVPTGLLYGKKVRLAQSKAFEIEREYIDENISEDGSRRFAWIFPEDVTYRYKEEQAWGEITLYLPKGSYATVFLEELAKREMGETSKE